MSRVIPTVPLPRADLRGLVTRNVPLKAAAIGVALVAWVVLSTPQQEVESTQTFDAIPVQRSNVPESYVIRGSLGTVGLTVRGPTDALRDLSVSSFVAQVDLGRYDVTRAGDLQELAVHVLPARDQVRVVSVAPSLIGVRLVPVETKKMSVQVRFGNQPPVGFQSQQPAVTPGEVTVRGPSDALREVVSIVAAVRFADAPNDLRLSPRALPVDAAGHEVADVEVAPQNVEVAVAVEQAVPTRTIGIVPILRGQPGAGFWVAAATSNPAVVTIRGDQAALDAVDHLETLAIDVSGANADQVVRAALVLPSGTSLAQGGSIVQVSVLVRPLAGTRLFSAAAVPQGLRSDLVADIDPGSIDVVLAGPLAALQAVRPEQVAAVVDLAGRPAGSYQVDAVIRAPAGLNASTPNGARVNVVVRSRS